MKSKIFLGFICTLFIIHFTLTALTVLPFNPIKNKLNTYVTSYMEPVFAQNWKLFAPNPLSNNYYVNVQIKDKSGNKSKWIDISTPLYEKNHTNRISPINKVVRLGTSAYMQSIQVDELSEKIRQKEVEQGQDTNNEERDLTDYNKDGIQQLYNLGYYYAQKQFKESEIDEIRIRVLNEEAIPFSERNNEDFERKRTYVTYDWVSMS